MEKRIISRLEFGNISSGKLLRKLLSYGRGGDRLFHISELFRDFAHLFLDLVHRSSSDAVLIVLLYSADSSGECLHHVRQSFDCPVEVFNVFLGGHWLKVDWRWILWR